jgi:hypothetical protein
MKKDELIKIAKEKHNVELNPKHKLKDLEAQVESLDSKVKVEAKEEPKSSGKRTPIASKSEHGKVVAWSPKHREEFWTFIYDERSLLDEEKKALGL